MVPSRAVVEGVAGLAVALALWSHAFGAFALAGAFPPAVNAVVRAIVWTTTPLVGVAFGMALEWLGVPRWRAEERAVVLTGLARFAALAYAGFVVVVSVAVLAGHRGPGHWLPAVTFVAEARYGNLLKILVVECAIAVAWIALAARAGAGAVVAASLALWGADRWLAGWPWPPPSEPLSYLTGLLFGRPVMDSAVSLLHCQVFFAAGMLLGTALRDAGLDDARWRRRLAGVALACGAVVVAGVALLGPTAVVRGYLTRALRNAHHPLYYAIALLAAVAFSAATTAVVRRRRGRALPIAVPIDRLGRHAILAYTVGHALLNAIPPAVLPPPWLGAGVWLAFPAMVAWTTDRFGRGKPVSS